MAEYTEREAALRTAHIMRPEDKCLETELMKIPAADVAPVVHGQWIADGDGYHWTYNCSICAWKDGYPFNERHNYCPNCGARMDADTERSDT